MTEMNCNAVREEMLIADLDELRGIGDSDVARHIRGCTDCRARAQVLVRGHADLDAALVSLTPRDVVPFATRRRRKLAWIPLPLAAAAVLALLMIPRMRSDEELPNVDAIARMMFREQPVVTPAAGQQAMVIEKKEMTIVWLYSQERP